MELTIRAARPDELPRLGRLVAEAYAALPGMPGPDEQPDYYARLRDAAGRAANPAIRIFAAVDAASGEPIGCVDFIADVAHYGTGGSATTAIADAAGIRLLAVHPDRRGDGVGQALTRFCIEQARELGRTSVILHTTAAMQTAWRLYERLGFVRHPAIDFQQGRLHVFGFRLTC